FGLAFILRFDGSVEEADLRVMFASLPLIVGVKIVVWKALDIDRLAWRYIGMPESIRILSALVVSTALLLIWRASVVHLDARIPFLRHFGAPYGVLVIAFLLSVAATVGLRVAARWPSERGGRSRRCDKPARQPTLLIGAGWAGGLVVREIQ